MILFVGHNVLMHILVPETYGERCIFVKDPTPYPVYIINGNVKRNILSWNTVWDIFLASVFQSREMVEMEKLLKWPLLFKTEVRLHSNQFKTLLEDVWASIFQMPIYFLKFILGIRDHKQTFLNSFIEIWVLEKIMIVRAHQFTLIGSITMCNWF